MKYRPEIDGLRAVAVIAVILYHAKFIFRDIYIFEGGFIGVDVFFVISGYLITSIILREHKDKKFSLVNFYERRVRRILPALFTVMLATIPFAWTYMLPKAMKEYAGSILSALLFSSNIWFWQEDSYTAEPSALKPLLHTWSLSIEEQFYVLYPVTLLLLLKYFKGHITLVLAIVFGCSLLAAHFVSFQYAGANFYLLPTRAWELLAGGILAKLEFDRGRRAEPSTLTAVMPGLGMFMLCGAFFFFNDGMYHPSLTTALPVLGTMLLIWFCTAGELVTKLLSARPFVAVGLVSYSFYLWHFPIFAFSRIKGDPSDFDMLTYIAASFALAVATYFLIERPFRNKEKVTRKPLVIVLATAAAALIIWAYSICITDGFKEMMPPIIEETLSETPWFDLTDNEGEYCYGTYKKSDFCAETRSENTQTILLIGDSNIESISSALVPKALEQGYDIVTMNSSACYYLPGFFSITHDGKPRVIKNQPCDLEFQKKRTKKIYEYPGATIILGGQLDIYLSDFNVGFSSPKGLSIEMGYINTVSRLLSDGYNVIQIAPFPQFSSSVSQAVRNYIREEERDYGIFRTIDQSGLIKLLSYPLSKFNRNTNAAMAVFKKIEHKNYKIVYPHNLFCDTIILDYCVSNNGKQLYFVDTGHPSRAGASLITEMIIDELPSAR